MKTNPKNREEPGFARHAFVCGHERAEGASRPSCFNRGSLDLLRELKSVLQDRSLVDVRLQKAGCLDHCEQGPSCVVYPESVWYSLRDEESIEAMMKHLTTGEVDASKTMKME